MLPVMAVGRQLEGEVRSLVMLSLSVFIVLSWTMAIVEPGPVQWACIMYAMLLIFSGVFVLIYPGGLRLGVIRWSYVVPGAAAGITVGALVEVLGGPGLPPGTISAVLALVVAPVVEELFFRGAVLRTVGGFIPEKAVVYGIVAGLFAAYHLIVWSAAPLAAMPYFAFGVLQCWLADRYDLAACITTHFCMNLAIMVLALA